MYGQRAKDLLTEMRRSDAIPPYNEEGVRSVIAETNALIQEGEQMAVDFSAGVGEEGGVAPDPMASTAILIHMEAANRNQRCLVAYHHPREVDYFKQYSKAVTDYMTGLGLDVTADMVPFDRLKREIRALRDCGEIMTASGGVQVLNKGDIIVLNHSDAEPLIRKGWAEDVTPYDQLQK